MPEDKTRVVPPLNELKLDQWCPEFEELMRNRLVMGSFRYGLLKNNSGSGFDSIGSALERLRLYRDTGNQEHLVDAANLCLVEFQAETHPNVHMSATDDGIHVKEK